MSRTNTLLVMDYNTATLHRYRVGKSVTIDDDFVARLGHNPDECAYMFADTVGTVRHPGIYCDNQQQTTT